MISVIGRLTVYFENPFWVGIFEIEENRTLKTCRVVFGSEPKDYEVYEFVKANYFKLVFGKPVRTEGMVEKKANPKRVRREISKALQEKNISTKAQQALKFEQESKKIERKKISKEQREQEKSELFEKRQKKETEKEGSLNSVTAA